jgi:tRNA A-37 threonylcarbamoyl transferase component Bud32
MAGEARIMEHVRSQGYPVPAVEEVSDDGQSMVIERIEGGDMVARMTMRPWTIARQGRVLADLHRR